MVLHFFKEGNVFKAFHKLACEKRLLNKNYMINLIFKKKNVHIETKTSRIRKSIASVSYRNSHKTYASLALSINKIREEEKKRGEI